MQTTTTKTLRPLTDVSPDEFAQMIKEVRKEAGYMDAIRAKSKDTEKFFAKFLVLNPVLVGQSK